MNAELLGRAEELLKKHGSLSVTFLIRKLMVNASTAREIMLKLGQDVYITAEEYWRENGMDTSEGQISS